MQRYLVERTVRLVLVLFFLSIMVFTIVRLIPGDPAAVMLGTEATPQVMAQIRRETGLDQPIVVQYVRWLRAGAAGNFGTSWVSKQPALALILGALPVTLQLVASAFVVALLIAFPDRGYEVDTSPFRPGTGEQVVEASLALLAALRA